MLSLIRCSDRGFVHIKKERLGQIEASLRKAVNNKADREPGPFAINVSQVIQFSSRSVLTFNSALHPASWDALYYTFR